MEGDGAGDERPSPGELIATAAADEQRLIRDEVDAERSLAKATDRRERARRKLDRAQARFDARAGGGAAGRRGVARTATSPRRWTGVCRIGRGGAGARERTTGAARERCTGPPATPGGGQTCDRLDG